MGREEQISGFITSLVSDVRLRPIHIALSTALCHAWIASQFRQPYSVSRSKLMQACRIHSKATYHKTLRELLTNRTQKLESVMDSGFCFYG